MISELLCQGEVQVPPMLLAEVSGRIAPFIERGVAELHGATLRIPPAGLPYARTVAALFDPYRQDSLRRFSSAV